jgi:hypothetical protein
MTIWLLVLVLFAGSAMVGYNQGAIRVAVSTLGLIAATLLALPLSPIVKPLIKGLLGLFSVTNPLVLAVLAPLVTFGLIVVLFKIGAFALHRQVEVYYKYKTGDLRLSLWERLNKRLGACLAPVNALIYAILISLGLYLLGYWTVQMSQGDADPATLRWVNRAAKDLHATGLDKAARALDPMKDDYYTVADIVGIVYHNPLAGSRLSHYPPMLGLAERSEFKDLANDKDFAEMLQRQVSVAEVLNHPKTKAILANSGLLKEIWGSLVPDLTDLREYMVTGKSAKYDSEWILGRWQFDFPATLRELRQSNTKPGGYSVSELKVLRKIVEQAFSKAVLVATPKGQVYLKGVVWIRPPKPGKPMEIPTEAADRAGDWSTDGSGYKLSLDSVKTLKATFVDNKMKLKGEWTPLVFVKE